MSTLFHNNLSLPLLLLKYLISLAFFLKTYFNEMYENDHSQYVQYTDIMLYYDIVPKLIYLVFSSAAV